LTQDFDSESARVDWTQRHWLAGAAEHERRATNDRAHQSLIPMPMPMPICRYRCQHPHQLQCQCQERASKEVDGRIRQFAVRQSRRGCEMESCKRRGESNKQQPCRRRREIERENEKPMRRVLQTEQEGRGGTNQYPNRRWTNFRVRGACAQQTDTRGRNEPRNRDLYSIQLINYVPFCLSRATSFLA
jgi:hypothetical protein